MLLSQKELYTILGVIFCTSSIICAEMAEKAPSPKGKKQPPLLIIDDVIRKDDNLQIACNVSLPSSNKESIILSSKTLIPEVAASTEYHQNASGQSTLRSETVTTNKYKRATCSITAVYIHNNETQSIKHNLILPDFQRLLKPGESVNIIMPELKKFFRKSPFTKDQYRYENMPDKIIVWIRFPEPAENTSRHSNYFSGDLTAEKVLTKDKKTPRASSTESK